MAGMAESIYDYDSITGSIREQFIEFPDVTYYEIGQVEVWEKTLSETDYYGNANMILLFKKRKRLILNFGMQEN